MSPMVKRAKRAVQALGKIAQNEKTITTLEGKRRYLKEKALATAQATDCYDLIPELIPAGVPWRLKGAPMTSIKRL